MIPENCSTTNTPRSADVRLKLYPELSGNWKGRRQQATIMSRKEELARTGHTK